MKKEPLNINISLHSTNIYSMAKLLFIVAIFFTMICFPGANATKFTIKNNCRYTIWPATLGGHNQLSSTGFELASKSTRTIEAPQGWSGRIWGRTGCSTDIKTGKFTCQTADCGNGLQCAGLGGASPLTLVELTLGATDFYDISLVDGFNLPVSITPVASKCIAPVCKRHVNRYCPADQAVRNRNGGVIGCLSACTKFKTPEYCCNGAHSTPETCPPSTRSVIFKKLCPQAYSYAYDDKTSTFTCPGSPDYVVTFCP